MGRLNPYAGISGITTRQQANAIVAMVPGDMTVAIGVLASAKTLAGGEANRRSPRWHDIRYVFPDEAPNVLRVLHYHSKSSGDALWNEVYRALIETDEKIDAIQLNVTWPAPDIVETARTLFPHVNIILQVGPAAMAFYENDAETIALRCRDYAPYLSGVLLDVSAGTGRPIHVAAADTMVEELYRPTIRENSDKVVGIAGGLGTRDSLARLRSVLRRYPRLCVDAESALRTNDELDMQLVAQWLRACEEFGVGRRDEGTVS